MNTGNRLIALLLLAGSPLAVASGAAVRGDTAAPAAAPATAETAPAQAANAKEWWPKTLDLTALRQHEAQSSPYGPDFDYAKEFASLDLDAVKADIRKVLTTSQPWWPADYGHYGPFFIRMAWHSAGTYRTSDGRGGSAGGELRFEPLNSWPDNVNLDKARRLVWPIKQKYGRKLSWGDLMVLTGNVAMEDMGFKTLGFAGGRVDSWQPDLVFWGPEAKLLADQRRDAKGNLKMGLAATQMGLIYVNPEGPGGVPDPLAAAMDIRRAFGAMAMDDEETAALIAGGHTFGKAHGAHKPEECVSNDPGASPVEKQGLGWTNKCGKGNAEDSVTSGLEGAWSANPIQFTTQYLDNLYGFEWVKTKSPAGAIQWIPTEPSAASLVPDAHIAGKTHAPIMFTTDIAMREDPGFRKITTRWRENPEEFADAFARAWFKLTHRDMGPQSRYIGKDVPTRTFVWQDPLPKATYAMIADADVAALKGKIAASGLSNTELVRTAWAAASTFRSTDMRGGANGARIRLNPQRGWAVNNPAELDKVLGKLEAIRAEFNRSATGGKQVSLADLIVLAGNVGVEQAAAAGGNAVTVPFTPGRVDATQDQTDVESFALLEPKADGFRNYYTDAAYQGPAEALIDKADMLALTVPEMTVLLGGMRAMGANAGDSKAGVFTSRPGTLTNDYFVNLLSMDNVWTKASAPGVYEGKDRATGTFKWTATPVDLIFGSNAELRAVSEVYASSDGGKLMAQDFAKAWAKVMSADRF
ncbi:catalase/peroxidase HPI [Sphingomonas sp. BGYR3]|uniref:catalase/peroxidase HPI n=1 Tax=Sphingomonas sp. BGYR3 TaxID=2975483 RepID=UPI0021A37676|nr:catalase/peroxidase HPI [Sphingomonas sp. BGYR3]MDG5489828.1 catalase/peroxidase HPI [Sphingomonas sp. BGYR3]